MRIERPITLMLIVSFFPCVHGQQARMTEGTPRWEPPALLELSGGVGRDPFEFDIVQRTCALYVAVRSAAFESPMEFGREVDDSMVHWNMCPGGTMVACIATPTANGDTIVTGIPWSH